MTMGTASFPDLLFGAPGLRSNPYPVYRALRMTDRVHWNPPGLWVVTGFAEADAVLRNHLMSSDLANAALAVSSPQIAESGTPGRFRNDVRAMAGMDPPDHTRLKRLVLKTFTPRFIGSLRGDLESLVRQLFDGIGTGGSVDLVDRLAYPFPLSVICSLLGVPAWDRRRFQAWSRSLVYLLDPGVGPEQITSGLNARDALEDYFRDLLEERRRRPAGDLLSSLAVVADEGDRLTTAELVSMSILLLVGGYETTANFISNGMLALIEDPDQLRRLLGHPELAASAVEELLRYDAPVQLTSRLARADLDLAGRPIRRGQEVVVMLGAANRDPERFPEPERLDLARGDNHHLAFGGGVHFCLGAVLARLEGLALVEALARRLRAIELAGPVVWRDTITFHGLRSLPVRIELAPEPRQPNLTATI